MRNMDFWALPGPESFCGRILATFLEGKSAILFLPEHMPDGLKRFVKNAVMEEAADKSFDELSQDDFEPGLSALASLFRLFEVEPKEDSNYNVLSCETLSKSDSFKNRILWIEETDDLDLQGWLTFLQKYERASRNSAVNDRTLFCLCLYGRSPESVGIKEDVCLKFLQWKKYVDFFDMLLYAHWNFSNPKKNGELFRKIAVNVAGCLALWDPEVIERLAEVSFQSVLSPYGILEEIGRERGWDDKCLEPCWENGTEEIQNGRKIVHSSFLALHGSLRELNSRIWKGQNIFLLPLIEEQRLKIIESLKGRLQLPFPSCYDYLIEEAEDLEIGHVWFQIERGDVRVTDAKKQHVSRLRRLRNVLAHHQVVNLSDLEFLVGCS